MGIPNFVETYSHDTSSQTSSPIAESARKAIAQSKSFPTPWFGVPGPKQFQTLPDFKTGFGYLVKCKGGDRKDQLIINQIVKLGRSEFSGKLMIYMDLVTTGYNL